MFPQGGPGVALLLLRISVAAVFLLNAAGYLNASYVSLLFVCAVLASASLSVGFLTPYLSVIACAAAAVHLLLGPGPGNLIHITQVIDAAALALLGPGAYSVDARLFGRRVTVIAPGKKGYERPRPDGNP
jgi:hypothetical protein